MRAAFAIGLSLLALSMPLKAQEGEAPAPEPVAETPAEPETIPVAPAQEEPAPVAEGGDAPTQLDDMVVTATKREKSVREIPASISALYGEQLEKMNAKDIQDYIALTPGITLQEGSWGDVQSRNITVRGVGSAPQTNQAVGQFIGDTPMTDPYSNFITPDLDPYDLRSVEILKGPQGTYFGASALNGAIRYVPNVPEFGEWNARGYADWLAIEQGGAEPSYGAALNVPLGDTLALRGMGVLQNAPGIIDNLQRGNVDADGRRKWSARVAARWEPGEDWSVNVMALQQEARMYDALTVDNDREELTNDSHPGPTDVESGFTLYTADVRKEVGDFGTLVVQGSRQAKQAIVDADSGAASGNQGEESLRGYINADIDGTTVEVRLVSADGGKWNWIVGAFGLDYTAHIVTDLYTANTETLAMFPELFDNPVITERGYSAGGSTFDPLKASEYALFGEVSRRFWDDWEATVGARVYKTEQGGVQRQTGTAGPIIGDATIDQQDDGISPRVSLTWQANDNILAYATVSRGYQFGGVNAETSLLPAENPATGVPIPPTFKSSTVWNREIGVRTDWFGRTLRGDLTYFNLDWNEAQFKETRQNLLLVNNFVSNVGKVHSQGLEGALTWLTPFEGLTLNVTAAWTEAVTKVAFNAADGSEVPVGSQMPATPEWQTAASATYTMFIGNWTGAATLTDTWSSTAYSDVQHTYEIYDKNLLNLNLSVARADWWLAPSLALVANNLTDERQVVGYVAGTSIAAAQTSYSRPRSVSVRLNLDF